MAITRRCLNEVKAKLEAEQRRSRLLAEELEVMRGWKDLVLEARRAGQQSNQPIQAALWAEEAS